MYKAVATLWIVCLSCHCFATDGNRLAYLDENDPYYVSLDFPRLTTPQWIGEDGVELAVVLSIDDMRDVGHYENFLRPILDRLKKIDGRAPISIMTNSIPPAEPHLQTWLAEGLSLETHTIDHPCPLLSGNDFPRAKSTFDRCVDLLTKVEGNLPVAFRMPCMDSLNTPSPRFFAEIFNRVTPAGNFLTIDSSICNIPTAADAELPRRLLVDDDEREKFRKYVPFESYVNTIENYPYPYVIGKLCWQFPCAVPSDWQAQKLHGVNNPVTVNDLKAAVDIYALKKGTFSLIFHPHGWIRNTQLVDLVDHAVKNYGRKVKFLNFDEAAERIRTNLLEGEALRGKTGRGNGVRLLDLDGDGFLDVIIGNARLSRTRLWSAAHSRWSEGALPLKLIETAGASAGIDAGARFGILREDGAASMICRSRSQAGGWHFENGAWVEDPTLLRGLELDGKPVYTSLEGRDQGVRLRDLDNDGICELIVANPRRQAVFRRDAAARSWRRLPFSLPRGAIVADDQGRDAGLRFIDVDEDLRDDLVYSNDETYSLDLFSSMDEGWSRRILTGRRDPEKDDPEAIPPFVSKGMNLGAFVHSRHLWIQNEKTSGKPNLVDRRSFTGLLKGLTPEARSPQASLRSIRTRPGLRVELMAAEPLVRDPVAFDWGADGKLWVAEMIDYPLGKTGDGKEGGKVVYLEDTDADGSYDKSTIFLEGLNFPNGVRPWGKGVLITAAPDIIYAEDTDGDGKADKTSKLYSGFGLGNQQHRMNTLAWGLDGWLHCANGDSGGKIRSLLTGKTTSINGRDFRIRPDEGLLDTTTGQTQFSTTRDDWGNWFGCQNPRPMFHFVLTDSYIRRNPHSAAPGAISTVAPNAGRVYPRSRLMPRFNDQHGANHFTSANGLTIYRDNLLGPGFNGNAFVSEPVHNLVHRIILEPKGVTFGSRRARGEERSEFLASSDNWFRPTMIRTGPDGGLWIADMYRGVIEHPQYFYEGNFKKLKVRSGDRMGRLYRVVPAAGNTRPLAPLSSLAREDAAGLAAATASPNGWVRDFAHQALARSRPAGAVPRLARLALKASEAPGRVQALCALGALRKEAGRTLMVTTLAAALKDPHPGVRRHALRLSEAYLQDSPRLQQGALALEEDPDAHVRLQLAYSLGEWNSPAAGRSLGKLALANAGNRYITAAVLSSAKNNLEELIAVVFAGAQGTSQQKKIARALSARLLPLAAAFGKPRAIAAVLAEITRKPAEAKSYAAWQFDALSGLAESSAQEDSPFRKELEKAGGAVKEMLRSAAALISDPGADEALRNAAVRLVGRSPALGSAPAGVLETLAGLLNIRNGLALQELAVDSLARFQSPEVPTLLLSGWKGQAPSIRSRILTLLLRREEWLPTLLDTMESGLVATGELDALERAGLTSHPNAALRKRAKALLGAVNADRAAVIRKYQVVKTLTADPQKGFALFEKYCTPCHRLGDAGHQLGPDLAALVDKSTDAMLSALLDPNLGVERKYSQYTAVTTDGRITTGIISEETGTSVTILAKEGKKTVFLRNRLARLESNGKSMMPEGLEKDLDAQSVADLIAALQEHYPSPKKFPGNTPRRVETDTAGKLTLSTDTCSIYGKSIQLEKRYGNLGMWRGEDDMAVWQIEIPAAGKYEVAIEWACTPATAGNQAQLVAADDRLLFKVESTGSWDQYRTTSVGKILLRSGIQRIRVHSAGPISQFLMDLRKVTLSPGQAK